MPDQELVCRDCGAAYLFTEDEQEFFRTQGFTHPPKRCKACRARQRQRAGRDAPRPRPARAPGPQLAAADAPRAPHDAPAQAADYAAPFDARHPFAPPPARAVRSRGPMHTTSCSLCAVPTEVPFVPDGVRPVFCLPCLKKQTR